MNQYTIFSTTLLFLLLAATPGWAQSGNQSDVTGVNTTGSTIAGYGPGTPGGSVEVAASPAVNAAIGASGISLATQLTQGALAAPSGATISASVQSSILGVMNGTAPAPPGLTAALGASAGAAPAAALVQALENLLGSPSIQQLSAAVDAFNSIVEGSAADYLASPPEEFVAVQVVLAQMIDAVALVGGE